MTKLKVLLILIVVCAIFIGCGEKPAGEVTKKVLKNGLTVLVKEDHKSPVVSIVTLVKAGYFNEPDSITGISHLLEHMFFKGTKRRGVGELARETRTAGGYLNAGTGYEQTTYYTVLPSKSFEKGLDIQSDALVNSAIDPDELRKESKVVIQEIKRKLDNPNAYSYEKLMELGFDKHWLRRWRMGYEEQVAGWPRDYLYNYYQTRYRPENIIVAIVGDIDKSQAFKLIEEYYGDIPVGEFQTEFSPSEPPQNALKYRRMTADITRNIVHVGFHVPGALDDDYYPLTVLNSILSDGRASRLYQEIKENLGLAQSVSSYNDAYKDFGCFVISAEQNKGKLLELINGIFEQVERLKIDKVSRAELQRALNRLESSYLHSLEEVNGQARNYASYEAYGDYKLADTYLDKLRAVTAEDIQKVAVKYFTLNNASIFEYLPADNKYKELSAEEFNRLLAETQAKYQAGYEPSEPGTAPEITAPAVGGQDLADQPAQKKVLSNGITVICRENHSLPIVSTAAYFYGGRFTENENNSGITQLMVKTAIKGTANMSAADIASAVEGMGSSISYEVDKDYFGFTFESMSKNFEEGFSIFTRVILNPSFPPDELQKEKKDLLAAINRQKDSMRSYPIELCAQALYENHPYGMPSLGNIEAIEKIDINDLLNMHASLATTGNLVIVFVGDITLDEAVDLTSKYFSEMNASGRTEPPSADVKLSSIHSIIKKRNKAQSAQAFAFFTCDYASPDYEPLKIYQNIVSGMGGRLWTEVRDKRSLAYSVYGYQSSGALTGSFICCMATSPENAVSARQVALDVLTGFKDKPLSDEELQRAKNYIAGSFSIYLQPNAVQADLYARWELTGKGFKAVNEYPDLIYQVQAEQVLAVATKYFSADYYGLGMIEGRGATVEERE